jgi:hypothetical protein
MAGFSHFTDMHVDVSLLYLAQLSIGVALASGAVPLSTSDIGMKELYNLHLIHHRYAFSSKLCRPPTFTKHSCCEYRTSTGTPSLLPPSLQDVSALADEHT